MAIYLLQRNDPDLVEIDLKAITQKLAWMKQCLGMDSLSLSDIHLKLLEDYNFITVRTVKASLAGFRTTSVKVVPKIDKEQIKLLFADKEMFQAIFANA